MNILMATSEVVPFAKTGGLADVCGALPVALSRLGHSVSVILPAYREALESGQPIEDTGIEFDIPIGSKIVSGSLLRSPSPHSGVTFYLVRQDSYFDRPELYREEGEDYRDNSERFVFFCRAVLEVIRAAELEVDVLHVNDWPTGLIPVYLELEYRGIPGYEQMVTVMTIHNMAYQGQFWHWDMLLTGIDWKYFNWHQLEFWGKLNLLKSGLIFADAINTVSPRYAQEIQSAPLGCGLEGVLAQRADVLSGIINGVDYAVWNPAKDQYLAAQYNVETWRQGKPKCKADLQRQVGLPELPDVPLLGCVGRLVTQKGVDLVAAVLERATREQDAQWVILGSGDPEYHELLQRLAAANPDKVAVRLEFSDKLAHCIEAGADMFVMPSHYEPCGLSQLYSLKYGTVPIVRETGGLADTIENATAETLANGTANGFSFLPCHPDALADAIRQACDLYRQPEVWSRIVAQGMGQDWSWDRSAAEYVNMYETTIARVKQTLHA